METKAKILKSMAPYSGEVKLIAVPEIKKDSTYEAIGLDPNDNTRIIIRGHCHLSIPKKYTKLFYA